ncbi:hypothetical protein BT96DRAFT_850351 [Gymnopus androsaceus JB14]|uniref:Required for respiratory growth protein 7, mitochondrial n=1 Tax=Gymnopus androsaceus JB14 TaxID=1447944 RepID=A0A6A4IDC2_9AGAR|nr:hypothetical protein BT96DRAFT_850351 [Gymnopus androsaceus JB14]
MASNFRFLRSNAAQIAHNRKRIIPLTYGRRWYSTNPGSSPKAASTVFRGTSFENRCLHLLQTHLGMVLQRVGGKDDGGVDLNGWWWLPDVNGVSELSLHSRANDASEPSFKRIRILAQCKAEKKKIGPKYVRELEGVVWRYMGLEREKNSVVDEAAKDPTPVVAVFLSESSFTKSTILRAMSSQVPFLLVYVPPLPPDSLSGSEDLSTSIGPGSCIYNPAFGGSAGLFKGEMEVRWCWSLPNSPSSPPLEQIVSSESASSGAPALFFRGMKLRGWVPLELHKELEEVD